MVPAEAIARRLGVEGTATPLPGELDDNFRVRDATGTSYVLKLHRAGAEGLDLQDAALRHVGPPLAPALVATGSWEGRTARLLSWVEGMTWAQAGPPRLDDLGRHVAQVDRALADFEHPDMRRAHDWDVARAGAVARHLPLVEASKRGAVERALSALPDLAGLPHQVVHNDANEANVLVDGEGAVAGLIDYGDVVWTARVCGLAVACAYARAAGLGTRALVAGYESVTPLEDAERAVLEDLVRVRLAMSVCLSAARHAADPGNDYLLVSQAGVWAALERDDLLRRRRARLSGALSLAYAEPLHIVRGEGAYLYDGAGRRYLDLVNNVAHVGHQHPRVVAAGQAQMARLNTNTRYLHDTVLTYAERLVATLPDPLEVVFFVNSGSEANDLALRLARAHTGRDDVLVLDHAYHGHLTSTIALSPYKFGADRPPRTQVCAVEDVPTHAPAAFFAEAIGGCAGQVVRPPGALATAFAAVRAAGGVCVADEVQTGFGRVGPAFWAFGDAVPDVVTLGKPMGNGHPVAGVVTTRAIAASFDATGMEYFNTFGGNPVSAAIGLAVLDVLADERLPERAARMGARLMDGLRALDHPEIADVRGEGLFIGVELTSHERAQQVKEAAKDDGVLLSTDGPDDDVLKIKPPLVLSADDCDEAVAAIQRALSASCTTRA